MSDTEAANLELTRALFEPFDPSQVKWKPGMVSGNRALALAYVDARVVQDRLDEVLGIDGWQDEYTVLENGSVMCKLRLRIGSEWIVKMDVGSQSEQPDDGDRMKAAFSDALKRTAVKFGVGRYLYRLPSQWVDYDPVKKKFVKQPSLPHGAVPVAGKDQRKEDMLREQSITVLEAAAKQGRPAMEQAWKLLSESARAACTKDLGRLKEIAKEAEGAKV